MSVVAPPGDRAVDRRRPGMHLTPAGAGLILIVIVLLFALTVPVRSLMQQRSDVARLQREERLLQQQNGTLRQQVARLHDPAYLERIARECLGMTRPGEISFVVVPKGPVAPSGSSGSNDTGPADSNQAAC